MIAILSDIHGNLEALHAVLEDAASRNVDGIYCLGDLIGYGPNPRECLDLAMQWKVVLQGNFDLSVLSDSPDPGPTAICATRSLTWSRRQVTAPIPDRHTAERRWAFLSRLSRVHSEKDLLFLHGSPREPLNEYVFPEDIYNQQKMTLIFAQVERYCFHGHTHVPGVIVEHDRFLSPMETDSVFRLDGRKTLVNVGSVGQPRDGDWHACYALLDGDTVRFRRVKYDIGTTVKKIRDIDDFDDFFGDRLGDGQ